MTWHLQVICAGFFTELPALVAWIRHISPIYYTFKAIVKIAYKWDDTYKCVKGQSIVGPNECFLETNAAIDNYKQRGINVATFGDPSSNQVHSEIIMLFVVFVLFQVTIIVYHWLRPSSLKKSTTEGPKDQETLDDRYIEKTRNGRQSIFLKDNNELEELLLSQSVRLIDLENLDLSPSEQASVDQNFPRSSRFSSHATNDSETVSERSSTSKVSVMQAHSILKRGERNGAARPALEKTVSFIADVRGQSDPSRGSITDNGRSSLVSDGSAGTNHSLEDF